MGASGRLAWQRRYAPQRCNRLHGRFVRARSRYALTVGAPVSLAAGFRAGALDARLTRADARRVLADAGIGPDPLRRQRPPFRSYSFGTKVWLVVVTLAMWVCILMTAIAVLGGVVVLVQKTAENPLALLSPVGLALGAALLSVGLSLKSTGSVVRRARLLQLAQANGWGFVPHRYGTPDLRGTLFTRGRDQAVHDVIRIRERPTLAVGELSFVEGDGRSKVGRRYGFVAMRLTQRLPHIMLDSHRNGPRGAITLSAGLAPEQYLPLEGDFDRTFRLWCPAGFERDALYLFTPDIMALFLDHAASLDVEILDGWLYLYGHPSHVNEPTEQRWLATLGIVDALAVKLDQWDRWRDDRKRPSRARGVPNAFARPAPGVSAGGARLRVPDARERRRQKLRTSFLAVGALVIVYAVIWGVGAYTWS